MSDKSSDQASSGSREYRRRRGWWERAKHFVIEKTGMYDFGRVGDNANIHFTEFHIDTMHVGQGGLAPSALRVVQGERNGLPGNYQMSHLQLMC